tara:strand:+ start:21948 stop:22556 length:609 start_codon:yes stop_codon:yes gene_type:complete
MKSYAFLLLLIVNISVASGVKTLVPIGQHYEVFRLEKSENPQNILVVYTRLDDNCLFELNPENSNVPVFGFYWLMDRKNYKPVHPLIRRGISKRLQVETPSTFPQERNNFTVLVKDLTKVDRTLENAYVKVSSRKDGKSCVVKSSFDTLGESKLASALTLDKIYAESEITFLPPFRKVIMLKIQGQNEKTGLPEEKIFQEKK